MGLLRDARVFVRQLETSPRNQQENEQVEPDAFPDSGVGDCFSRCFSFQGCKVLYKYQKFITGSLRSCNVAMENLHSSWQIDGGKSLLTSWDGWNTSHYPYQLGTIRLLDLDGWYYPKSPVLAGIEWSSRSGFFDCGGSFRKSKEASLNWMCCFSFVIDVYKGNSLIWEYLGIPSFRHTSLVVFSLVRSTGWSRFEQDHGRKLNCVKGDIIGG